MPFSFLAREAGRVHVCGHRGYSLRYPENTLPSFGAAKAWGATTIEIDVVLTAEGEPIVLHDRTLDRTTDGHGFVADLGLEQIRSLDAGARFDARFAGTRVPTIAEIVDWAKREEMGIFLEIKEAERPDLAVDRVAPAGGRGRGPASTAGPPPAWTGFRPLLVVRKNRESSNVTSLILEPVAGQPLQAALPGQFIVLRLKPAPDAPALRRSYSLSGEPSEHCYRISVKRETHGAAGAYTEAQVKVGDVLEVSAPRGNFTLRQGDGPVVGAVGYRPDPVEAPADGSGVDLLPPAHG